MPTHTITVRATPQQVRQQLAGLGAALTGGGGPQGAAIARGLQLRVGTMALSLIKQSYVDKARGGGGADGKPWAPLAASTIERRLRKAKGGISQARAVRNLKEAYATVARTGRGQKKLERARKKAAETFAAAGSLEVLRDTGRLLNSLSPGIDGPSGNPDQVFRHESSACIVGTNVKYGAYHHAGTSRMPQRRLWPEPKDWPASWNQQLGEAARSGVVRAVELLLSGRI